MSTVCKFVFIVSLLFLYSLFLKPTAASAFNIDLETAMNLSESHSFSVKKSQSDKDNASVQKNFALTQLGPSLNSAGSWSWYDQRKVFPNVNTQGEGNLSSSVMVTASESITGIFSNSLKSAQMFSALKSAQLTLSTQKNLSRLEGAQAYIVYQQALRSLEAKQSAQAAAEELYKETQVLFETGSVEKTKIDVLQTKAQAASSRTEVIFAKKDVQVALADIALKIGIEDLEASLVPLEKESWWEKNHPTLPSREAALKLALANRPDLRAAQESYTAQKYQLAQSSFGYAPQVNLFATYAKTSNDYAANLPSANVNQFYYGVNFNWTLWDGGLQAAALADLIKDKYKSQLDIENTLVLIKQDVFASFENLNSAILSLDGAKEAVKSYEEAYNLAKIQYQTGDYTALNLIDTQTKLTSAQVALANVRSDLDLSWMKLQLALGQAPHVTQE